MASLGTIAALGMYGAAREPTLAMAASLLAGASWIIMMTTLFVSAQVALPDWVRGRGLAIFLSAYFGAMTLGSAVWGKFASLEGLSTTLYVAAAGAFVGMVLTMGQKLQTAAALDLSPAMHWRRPVFAQRVDDDQGPVLVTLQYRIDPKDRAPFLASMQEKSAWSASATAPTPGTCSRTRREVGRVVEVFLVQSMLELKHLRAAGDESRPDGRGSRRTSTSTSRRR